MPAKEICLRDNPQLNRSMGIRSSTIHTRHQIQAKADARSPTPCPFLSARIATYTTHSWDYETCTFLVEAIGTDGTMFPHRPWTLDWLQKHCAARFGVVPTPTLLNDEWGFDAESLVQQGASRILFTNGLNDGWSAGGFVKNLSIAQDLLVLNMPNGAHHSDLRHSRPCPGPDDTADVLSARATATAILERWVKEIRTHSK